MRWVLGSFCILLALAACGNHIYINLRTLMATRDADDHVAVTATVECEAVGYPDCALGGEYCVETRWIDQSTADGGVLDGGVPDSGTSGLFDVAKACDSRTLENKERASLKVRSTRPIPRVPAFQIRTDVTSKVYGNNYTVPIQSP